MNHFQNSEIPDGETLFRYCYPKAFPEGQNEIPASVFADLKLSCDWQKYRLDPQSSFHISEGKTRLISIQVTDEIRNPRNPKRSGEIVPAWKQDIYHSPISEEDDPAHGENCAHSLIDGRKKIAVRRALVANSIWWDIAE